MRISDIQRAVPSTIITTNPRAGTRFTRSLAGIRTRHLGTTSGVIREAV